MSGPWEKYANQPAPAAPAGPWEKYAAPATAEAPAAPAGEQPWYAQAGQAADDIARIIANGLTFGYADKLAGAASGNGTEAERALTEQARDRAGSAGTVAEIGSAIAVPMAAGKSGLTLAGRFGTDAATGLRGLAGRTGLMAAEGAGYGALTAAGNDQSVGEGAALGAIGGGIGNLAGEGLSAAVGKAAGAFNPAPVIPTADDIRQSAAAAYKAADEAGVIYAPQAVDRLRGSIQTALADFGYDPALQPGAATVLNRINDLAGQNVTLQGVDTLRKIASNGYIPGNNANNKIVADIVNRIDDVVMNPAAGDVLGGDGAAGAAALKEARSLWSRLAKSGAVERRMDRAAMNAGTSGSGANVDNATRQQLKAMAQNPRETRGFTSDETDALMTAIMGTPTQNALRLIGKAAPTGIVSGGIGAGAGAAIGNAVAGPGGAQFGAMAVPAVGFMAKNAADNMTAQNAQRLIDIIMAGGSQAAITPAPNAVQRLAQDAADPITRTIMGMGAYAGGK